MAKECHEIAKGQYYLLFFAIFRGCFMEKPMDVLVIEHETKIKSLEKRMSKIEDLTKNVNEIAISVKELAVNQSRMLDEMKEEKQHREKVEERVQTLELKPSKNAEEIKVKVIIAVITTILGGLLGALLTLIIK